MKPSEMRQFSLQYSFPFKFFELIQYGTNQVIESESNFTTVFRMIKEMNLFALSRLYIDSTSGAQNEREFANYLIATIEESDYHQINFDILMEDYKLPTERYQLSNMAPYWSRSPRYIKPELMFESIHSILRLHISNTSEIFRFDNPTQSYKYGMVRIWDDLQHYICIDHKRKIVQLVTSGVD
jgi:hypothetical protein